MTARNAKLIARLARRVARGESGQAMVEYSVIAHALLIAGGFLTIKYLPLLIGAYQTYLNGFYFTLNLPFP